MWQQLSETLGQTFLGNSLWQYVGFGLLIFATLIARVVTRHVLEGWLNKLTKRTKTEVDDQFLISIKRPVLFLVYIVGFYLALEILDLPTEPVNIARFVSALFSSLIIVDAAWLLYSSSDIVVMMFSRYTEKTESKLDDQLVPIVRRACRVTIVVLAVITVIQNLGYSVHSLLAGLGLGGLAFALAAKDSLANIFGSVTIFTDRPFQVGDWVKAANAEGYVEDVGLRSTRIRTFEKTLITIPNSQLADSLIENMDARSIRRVKMYIGVSYETSAEQMQTAVLEIRNILKNHPGVSQDYWLVNFTDFGASSLNIFLYYFTKSTVWAEYLEVRQEINLLIMNKLEELNLEIAFPTQTIYLRGQESS
jgi:MscS family membrane protein